MTGSNISHTSLKEALKALAAEGTLELLPQRGARVAILDEEDEAELLPVIAAMEALAGELACDRISDRNRGSAFDMENCRLDAAVAPLRSANLRRSWSCSVDR